MQLATSDLVTQTPEFETAWRGINDRLLAGLAELEFSLPVAHVYNPLIYARATYDRYLQLYACSHRPLIMLGMNPGPFGMMQTGVPFGEVNLVKDWLQIAGRIETPRQMHARRPIEGFACKRSEVSGARLWGWAKERFKTPARFFAHFFVANYCPLAFLESSGRNRTPDQLASAERAALYAPCDRALQETVALLQARAIVAIGRFAQQRCRQALSGLAVDLYLVDHPSPANPRANLGWGQLMDAVLAKIGCDYG